MAKSSYIVASDDGFAHQLDNFKNTVGPYVADLGYSPAQVSGQSDDSDYFGYVLQCQEIIQNASRQWTAWKDLQRHGGKVPTPACR